jgi:hypothetical protein
MEATKMKLRIITAAAALTAGAFGAGHLTSQVTSSSGAAPHLCTPTKPAEKAGKFCWGDLAPASRTMPADPTIVASVGQDYVLRCPDGRLRVHFVTGPLYADCEPYPISKTTTTVAPGTATTAPKQTKQTCTRPAFETSAPFGGWTDGDYYVYNNMWNDSSPPSSGVGRQTLYACSYSNWYVVSDQPATTDVKTYPNAQENFKSVPVSQFSTLTSSFAETDPHVGIYEDAYDMWLNGIATSGSNEVMIWNEDHNQVPGGSALATVTLDGRAYTVWTTGNHSYTAFVAHSYFTSGTVNLLEFYDWLIRQGWLPSSSVVDQVDYGVEVCSTNRAPATFQFTNFSINATTHGA